MDNGNEFADDLGLEHFCVEPGRRTKIYCCHPSSSWERGSNENPRRAYLPTDPKGSPIEDFTDEEIQQRNDWINDDPRAIFGGRPASDVFTEQLAALA